MFYLATSVLFQHNICIDWRKQKRDFISLSIYCNKLQEIQIINIWTKRTLENVRRTFSSSTRSWDEVDRLGFREQKLRFHSFPQHTAGFCLPYCHSKKVHLILNNKMVIFTWLLMEPLKGSTFAQKICKTCSIWRVNVGWCMQFWNRMAWAHDAHS